MIFYLMSVSVISIILLVSSWDNRLCVEIRIGLVGGLKLEFPLLLDLWSLGFIFTVSFIARVVYIFSYDYMVLEKFTLRFHVLLILFVKSIFLLILSPNMFSLIIGWDGLGVRSYLLVIYFYSIKSLNAGVLTVLRNRVGDVFLIFSIMILSKNGSWEFWNSILNEKYNFRLFLVIILAAITKRAQVPFSSWLPAAIAAPTPVSALVHSSTLVTAGVYLLVRWGERFGISRFILNVGLVTMLMARIAAFFEKDIKKVVALSTLRQLGLIFVRLGLGLYEYAYFHLLVHAFFKATIFIRVGNAIHLSRNYQDLRFAGLVNRAFPLSFSFLLLTNIRLIAFPFLGGFYSKDLILEWRFTNKMRCVLLRLLLFSVAATIVYRVRFIRVLFFRGLKQVRVLNLLESRKEVSTSLLAILILIIIRGRVFIIVFSVRERVIFLPREVKKLIYLFMRLGFVIRFLIKERKKIYAYSWGRIIRLPFLRNKLNINTLRLSYIYYMVDRTWNVWGVKMFIVFKENLLRLWFSKLHRIVFILILRGCSIGLLFIVWFFSI